MSDVTWRGDEFTKSLDEIIRKKILKLAQRYERILQGLFRTAKHGRIYTHGSVEHRASAPGEAPAIDTAALAKGVTHSDPQKTNGEWSIDFGESIESGRAEIAAMLEWGTSKIEARPAWRPALEQLKQESEAALKEA